MDRAALNQRWRVSSTVVFRQQTEDKRSRRCTRVSSRTRKGGGNANQEVRHRTEEKRFCPSLGFRHHGKTGHPQAGSWKKEREPTAQQKQSYTTTIFNALQADLCQNARHIPHLQLQMALCTGRMTSCSPCYSRGEQHETPEVAETSGVWITAAECSCQCIHTGVPRTAQSYNVLAFLSLTIMQPWVCGLPSAEVDIATCLGPIRAIA